MIPVFKPSYGERELEALREPLMSGWVGLGPKTKAFEEKFADYMCVKHAVATNSATAALHLAMKIMDIEGKEVITTPMTFISTNHSILYCNADPVFCDIEPDTLNIDANKIESLITKRTHAIVCVHYGGYACDMGKILSFARKYNLKVIEDSAHGCGGTWNGQKLGTIGDIGCYSFHAVKNLATGEGGMVVTNDSEVEKKLRQLRWMGITKDTFSRSNSSQYSWYYDVVDIGYKYHMHDISASIGIVQLEKLDKLNKRRGKIVNKYNEFFNSIDWIETPVRKPYMNRPAYHNYVIKCSHRNELNAYLKENGIASGVHYVPNNHYKMYSSCKGNTPISDKVWKKILTLPLFPDLSDDNVEFISKMVSSFK